MKLGDSIKEKVLLSIICPAYNAEKTIGRLIESIVHQKYKNYELIILNDGSQDNTWSIIEKYSKKYKNIISINKENTGVGDTRNEGIKIAKGKYITFADSDDWYTEDFFEKIVPEIEKEDFELLYFNANVMNYEEFLYDLIPKKYYEESFIEQDGVKKYLQGEFLYKIGNVPWNKIYNSKIIKKNQLKYEQDKKIGQDLIFNILYVSKITKYRYINEKLYNYALNIIISKDTNYNKIFIEENIKYYKPLKKICMDNHIDLHYLKLFFLRRIPGIVTNEACHMNFSVGKENMIAYMNNKELKELLSKVCFKDMDLKLMICLVFYKWKLYIPYYKFKWKKIHM